MMSEVPERYPDDIRAAFEWCENCETPVVNATIHTCSPDGRTNRGHVNAEEREELANNDDRPVSEEVLYPTSGRSNRNAWAYHELDDTGDPLHDVDFLSQSTTGARQDAKRAGCYPCGRCRAIQKRREDSEASDE